MKIFNGKLRILHLLVLVGLLSFVARSGDFVISLSSLANATDEQETQNETWNEAGNETGNAKPQSLSIAEMAEKTNAIQTLSPGAGEDDNSDQRNDDNGNKTETGEKLAEASTDEDTQAITEKWRDALDTNLDMGKVEQQMLSDLAERRSRLNKKSRELAQREALLKAAEKELDQKYNEMAKLRDDIQELLEEQSEEEEERTKSLVKIYSGMKAKDAARIFNTLDQDIVVDIMTRMSERKTGPILAEMDSEKARIVTIMMAEQNKLPEIPQNFRN